MIEPVLFAEPFGHAGTNALAPLGFNVNTICILQDAGLVRPAFDMRVTIPPLAAFSRFCIAGETFHFARRETITIESIQRTRQFHVLRLTTAGNELWPIVHCTPNLAYNSKLCEWIEGLGFVREVAVKPAAVAASP